MNETEYKSFYNHWIIIFIYIELLRECWKLIKLISLSSVKIVPWEQVYHK